MQPLLSLVRLGTEVVIIRVGSKRTEFCVHADLLRANSAFFKAALSPGWKESKEGVVYLPEDNPTAFEVYVTWLYARKIATMHASYDEFDDLAEAIVLGEKLQDVQFKNALTDCLIACTENGDSYPPPTIVQKIYECTPRTAPVRRLLVDMWVWYAEDYWLTNNEVELDRLEKSFLGELASKLIKHQPASYKSRSCRYENRLAYHETETAGAKRGEKAQAAHKESSGDGTMT